jgi:alpha-tubulin suppressor-like RCC1 family protein
VHALQSEKVVQVCAAETYVVVRTSQGKLWYWGSVQNTNKVNFPTEIECPFTVWDVYGGGIYMAAVAENGQAYAARSGVKFSCVAELQDVICKQCLVADRVFIFLGTNGYIYSMQDDYLPPSLGGARTFFCARDLRMDFIDNIVRVAGRSKLVVALCADGSVYTWDCKKQLVTRVRTPSPVCDVLGFTPVGHVILRAGAMDPVEFPQTDDTRQLFSFKQGKMSVKYVYSLVLTKLCIAKLSCENG